MNHPIASIVIATHNKFPVLDRVLKSVYAQDIARSGQVEVIVVDDGSECPEGAEVPGLVDVLMSPILYKLIVRPPGYRNPSYARNVAAKLARGDILIMQSDDVVHHTTDTIERLIDLRPGTVNIATVWNQFPDGSLGGQYSGLLRQKAYFFLGSCRRENFHAVGGNDEEFTEPGWDDDWLAVCLGLGLGLEAVYREDIVGYHQDHSRPHAVSGNMQNLFWDKWNRAKRGEIAWQSSGGPWPFTIGKSYAECQKPDSKIDASVRL